MAYDASSVRIASGKAEDQLDEGKTMCKVTVKMTLVRRIERAVNPDITRLLNESDVSLGRSEDEGLEEDFVLMGNRAEVGEEANDEEQEVVDGVFLSDVEEDEELEDDEDEPKERVHRLLDGQFDLVSFFYLVILSV
ncbi:hypothetical protein GUJ93_ZPchr0013g33996 [Zizania palustris]|uniref:Uncharacterized protein n=1 Tax=Zizania palustris TaxID=103762 RepID=A0A8J6BYL3_ZIZPA|nr:hypothetical protein GUJ93_ZPchr0013g33996 [Zizania palustris]